MAYRVFLADDEDLIREGLRDTVPWNSLGLVLAGMAEDGRSALGGIRDTQPDIVITDIQMPYMDGLEMIRRIRELRPECHIIIITGFSEFTYAQTAIKLGVEDFLLKPVDIPNLCRTLRNITEKLDSRERRDSEIERMRTDLQQADAVRMQKLLRRFLNGLVTEEFLLDHLPEELRGAKAFSLVLLRIDGFDAMTADLNTYEIFKLVLSFEQAIERAAENMRTTVLEIDPGVYIVICFGARESALRYAMDSFVQVLRLIKSDLSFSTVTSAVYKEPEGMREGFRQIGKGSDVTFRRGANQDHRSDELEGNADVAIEGMPGFSEVLRALAGFDAAEIRERISALERDVRSQGQNSQLYMHLIVSVIYNELQKQLSSCGISMENIFERPMETYQRMLASTTLHDMISRLMAFTDAVCAFAANNIRTGHALVDRACLYIDAHYNDSGLTLNEVAAAAGISSGYLSTLFKQVTGKSFVSYLTDIRIEHAKELLRSGNEKTYEVAARCGYDNSTYFSTVFKRSTGYSPSEYAKRSEGPSKV